MAVHLATHEVAGTMMSYAKSGGDSNRIDNAAGGYMAVTRCASTGDISHCLNAGGMGRQDYETETLIAHSLRGEGFDASEDGTGRGTPLVPVCIHSDAVGRTGEAKNKSLDAGGRLRLRDAGMGISENASFNLTTGTPHAVAFQQSQSGFREHDTHATLDANNGSRRHNGVLSGSAVRRLTPVECERLQGFPDDFTLVPYRGKPAADGPRYKALGNSMAVPVMAWIGQRIAKVEQLSLEQREAA